jgi:hypothetical protein
MNRKAQVAGRRKTTGHQIHTAFAVPHSDTIKPGTRMSGGIIARPRA